MTRQLVLLIALGALALTSTACVEDAPKEAPYDIVETSEDGLRIPTRRATPRDLATFHDGAVVDDDYVSEFVRPRWTFEEWIPCSAQERAAGLCTFRFMERRGAVRETLLMSTQRCSQRANICRNGYVARGRIRQHITVDRQAGSASAVSHIFETFNAGRPLRPRWDQRRIGTMEVDFMPGGWMLGRTTNAAGETTEWATPIATQFTSDSSGWFYAAVGAVASGVLTVSGAVLGGATVTATTAALVAVAIPLAVVGTAYLAAAVIDYATAEPEVLALTHAVSVQGGRSSNPAVTCASVNGTPVPGSEWEQRQESNGRVQYCSYRMINKNCIPQGANGMCRCQSEPEFIGCRDPDYEAVVEE